MVAARRIPKYTKETLCTQLKTAEGERKPTHSLETPSPPTESWAQAEMNGLQQKSEFEEYIDTYAS